MNDVVGPGTVLGYCTNVHAGASLEQTLANLKRYALAVKARVSPGADMGVGLWLSAAAAGDLLEQGRVAELAAWLGEHGLTAFTLNGFPHGDFHQPVVKHRVYQPNWADDERLNYSLNLTYILSQLLPEGAEGSISTLPVGWGAEFEQSPDALAAAAGNLRRVAQHLSHIEQATGRLIHLDLGPEPGCYLDSSEDVVNLFQNYLFLAAQEEQVLRYLRVCYDICHSAVMFEEHAEAFDRYRRAGIAVGKVQVSSAVRARFGAHTDQDRQSMREQLGSFAEDRYLHQTVVRDGGDGPPLDRFFDDLPAALASLQTGSKPGGEWRIHFHVPLYLSCFGLLETTQDEVLTCLAELRKQGGVRHFEAETYAWNVLPTELQVEDLAEGIARELTWLREQASRAEEL